MKTDNVLEFFINNTIINIFIDKIAHMYYAPDRDGDLICTFYMVDGRLVQITLDKDEYEEVMKFIRNDSEDLVSDGTERSGPIDEITETFRGYGEPYVE